MNLFDWDKPALKIKNPVRLIELFAGIGAQAKALERLGVPFEHYKVVEIDRFAVASYGMKEQNALGAFIIHGKKVHRRTIGSAGGGAKHRMGAEKPRPERTGISVKRETEIHLCVQRKLRKKWQAQAQPYPKRKDDTL